MVPVEYVWISLILALGAVGMTRGLRRELGATTILLLSLFALYMGQELILNRLAPTLQSGFLAGFPEGTLVAIYYTSIILFVTFISYEGIVLQFPIKQQTGIGKAIFGFFGGLLNGYLVAGTIWNVTAKASYYGIKVPMGTSGNMIAIADTVTELHNALLRFLPVSLMSDFSPYIMLVLGMILLLAIVLK
jgi:hypothetical protein